MKFEEYKLYKPSTTKELRDLLLTFVGVCALDTETTSLRWYDLECEGISIACRNEAIWIDKELVSKTTTPAIINKWLKTIELLVMHNAPFDLGVLHKLGIFPSQNIFCTQTAAHLLNENKSKSLKDIATQIGIARPDTKKYKDVQFLGRDHEDFIRYAADDAIYTLRLWSLFAPELTKQGLDNLFYKIEMPFQFVLKDMKVAGIGADISTMNEFEAELNKIDFDLRVKLHESAGLSYTINSDLLGNKTVDSKWNFNSPAHLRQIIIDKLGLDVPFETDSGLPSIGKQTKMALKNESEFVRYLDLFIKANKLLSAFVRPFKEWVDGDGRIRADFNNTSTKTGRLSCSKPNLQQLAKENAELGVEIRRAFVAGEGKVLVSADFGGQELRVLAQLSKDATLLKCFKNGQDLHLTTANKIFKLEIPEEHLVEGSQEYADVKEKYKKERHIAKNGVLFPLIYGSTAFGISRSLGCSEDKAQEYIDSFFREFPAVKSAIDRCHKFLFKHGYVPNYSGRRRRFDKEFGKYTNEHKRQAFNYLVQGTSADQTKASMVLLHKELQKTPAWEAHIVMAVHDEIIVECKAEYCNSVASLLEKCMKTAYPLPDVEMSVETGVGKNYHEAK